MKLNLFFQGNFLGELDLSQGEQIAGRDFDCALVLSAYTSVSNRHARFVAREGRAYVRDLQSTNGTWLNGVRITEEIQINDGDTLRIGDAEFTVRVEASPGGGCRPASDCAGHGRL